MATLATSCSSSSDLSVKVGPGTHEAVTPSLAGISGVIAQPTGGWIVDVDNLGTRAYRITQRGVNGQAVKLPVLEFVGIIGWGESDVVVLGNLCDTNSCRGHIYFVRDGAIAADVTVDGSTSAGSDTDGLVPLGFLGERLLVAGFNAELYSVGVEGDVELVAPRAQGGECVVDGRLLVIQGGAFQDANALDPTKVVPQHFAISEVESKTEPLLNGAFDIESIPALPYCTDTGFELWTDHPVAFWNADIGWRDVEQLVNRDEFVSVSHETGTAVALRPDGSVAVLDGGRERLSTLRFNIDTSQAALWFADSTADAVVACAQVVERWDCQFGTLR
ncbi:MAG: hypothetical protein ACT4OV_05940 [Microthrixaceae bacterium]